jgi:plasmid stabilization system protein ParE
VIRRYRLTETAQRHIDEIAAFIAADSMDAALKVLDALEAAFDQIAEMPEIGHTREDLTLRPLKFWRVYSFLVVYEPTSDPLTVVAVLHGARDVQQILESI